MQMTSPNLFENLTIFNSEFEPLYQEKFKKFLDKVSCILGIEIKFFEESFANYYGTKYCVANGLDALILRLQVFDFPEKSEIIIPSNT
jgi:dTDP-4-amino-4,6-dideoxygalactose transaminase